MAEHARASPTDVPKKETDIVTVAKEKESQSNALELTYSKACLQVFLLCISFGLSGIGYYTLAGIQTSLYGVKGSVGLACSWIGFIIFTVLSPIFFKVFGLKTSFVAAAFGACIYTLTAFYDSWFTIVPGFFIVGSVSGPLYSGTSAYLSVLADGLARRYGDVIGQKYNSIFQGLTVVAMFGGAMLGNVLLSVLLYHGINTESTALFSDNRTNVSDLALFHPHNATSSLSSNVSGQGVCEENVDIASVSDRFYFLIGICLCLNLVGAFSSLGLISPTGRIPCSQVGSQVCTIFKQTFKVFVNVKYILAVSVTFFTGMDQGFFFGLFTLHFVSTCLGLGAVGLAVIVYCFGMVVSSLLVGYATVLLTRSLVAILTALLQAGMILFMLFWQREPSYVMVFLISLGWGVADGVWMTLPAIYLAVVSKNYEVSAAETCGLIGCLKALGIKMGCFKQKLPHATNPTTGLPSSDIAEIEQSRSPSCTDDCSDSVSIQSEACITTIQQYMDSAPAVRLNGSDRSTDTAKTLARCLSWSAGMELSTAGGGRTDQAANTTRARSVDCVNRLAVTYPYFSTEDITAPSGAGGDVELYSDSDDQDKFIFSLVWVSYAVGGSLSFIIISVSTWLNMYLYLLLALLFFCVGLFLLAEAGARCMLACSHDSFSPNQSEP